MDFTIVDRPEARRFEIHEGQQRVGCVEYHLYGGEIAFLHTEIDAGYERRGLGGALARHVLDDARARNRWVLPYCPFIQGWISTHPDYLDLVAQDQRARFELER